MLYLLPSPIGNLSDITLRILEILKQGSIFLCEDTRITQKLLLLLEQKGFLPKKERKFYAFHSHNQDAFLRHAQKSFFLEDVIFMSDAGMPCVSDPGSALVRYAQAFQIPYQVLPAGSAVTLAYSCSGFGDGGFVFDGFLPHKSLERKIKFEFWREHLAKEKLPLVVFESPHRLLESLSDLKEIDKDCEIFIIKEMTKKFERFFKGNILEVLRAIEGQNLQGEWVLVIQFSLGVLEQKIGKIEILELDIPPKIKAKLLSKITGESPKSWYEKIIEGNL